MKCTLSPKYSIAGQNDALSKGVAFDWKYVYWLLVYNNGVIFPMDKFGTYSATGSSEKYNSG